MTLVLQIEDNPDDAMLTELALSRLPGAWTCEAVRSVSAGLARLRRGGIDMVLLDLDLPDAAGVSAVREVLAVSPATPVVVMTGHLDEVRERAVLEAGARVCLVKHLLEADHLERILRDALDR